jgi:hypothetical protein
MRFDAFLSGSLVGEFTSIPVGMEGEGKALTAIENPRGKPPGDAPASLRTKIARS